MASITDVTNTKSNTATAELLLAVDAGGTKTVAWLVECGKSGAVSTVGRGKSTGGNPQSVGFDAATRAIRTAVEEALSEAQSLDAPIDRAILSIAGAANADVRNSLVEWARICGLARQVAIVSDFLPVLAAGTNDCVGVALVCGTGSSAFARNADGRTARRGGWGYLLGDEGSGFAIGLAAIQLALGALETDQKGGPLVRTVLSALRAESVSDVTHAVYGNADVRAKVAAMAPFVIAAADAGDMKALSILDSAARDLADLGARAARSVDLAGGPIQVAVSGGVLTHAQVLRDGLQAELVRQGMDCTICIVEEPLTGCVRLTASEFAGKLVTWK